MTTLYGPHIPYKDNAYKGLKPKEEWLNWLEVERWAARLSEQMGGFNWNASLRHTNNSVSIVGPATNTLTRNVEAWHSSDDAGFTVNYNKNFDTNNSWAILAPRDGVYSASASAAVSSIDPGICRLELRTSQDEWFADVAEVVDLGGGVYSAQLNASCDGFPLRAGEMVWAVGTLYGSVTMDFHLDHLSLTYEAELGPYNLEVGIS